jgi:WD40 repeat protein
MVDNKKIISGSYDTTIKIWDIETGSNIKTLPGHSG